MMRDNGYTLDQLETQVEHIWKSYLLKADDEHGHSLSFPRSMVLGDLVRRGIVTDTSVHAVLANRIESLGEGYNRG